MEPGSWLQLVLVLVLLLLSAFFSASETSLASLGKTRLEGMLSEKRKNAGLIQKILENSSLMLSTLLVGNNIINIGLSALITSAAIELIGNKPWTIGLTTVLTTLVLLIFGEITPKSYAVHNPEGVASFVAPMVQLCITVMRPVVGFLNLVTRAIARLLGVYTTEAQPAITEAELKTMVNVGHAEGVLEPDERAMIHNVFDFADDHAKDVMTPRTDMVALDYNATHEEIVQVFRAEQFSRVPVYKESNDHIVGILYLKDFIFEPKESFSIDKCMRAPFFTYENKPAISLFKLMRTKRIAVAVVLDEYGGTAGIVTLEDLIEKVVGDISDETDEPDSEICAIGEDTYLVDGSEKISAVNRTLGTDFSSDDFETIGGYVLGLFGSIPQTGDEVRQGGICYRVEGIDKNRIQVLRIQTHVSPAAENGAEYVTDRDEPSPL